jgi:hypothetical protein
MKDKINTRTLNQQILRENLEMAQNTRQKMSESKMRE